MPGTPLVTFKGWEGKWWKNIKPGRAALDAVLTVMPGSGLASTLGKRVGGKLVRSAASKAGRWFRAARGTARPGAHLGSRVTKGPLKLGKTKLMGPSRPGVGTVAKVGAGAVAAVGVGRAVGVGKIVKPTAAVTAAHSTGTTRPVVGHAASSSPQPRSSSRSSAAGAQQKRCGCPAGQRMMCFKRHHNPEAQAKRKARKRAAREKAKAKTAKRHAKEKAAASRRKRARAAKRARALLRGRKGRR